MWGSRRWWLMAAWLACAATGCRVETDSPAPGGGDESGPEPAAIEDEPAPEPDPSLPAAPVFRPPKGWEEVSSSSTTRAAQYRLPRVEGDAEDAELIIYYFGPHGAGPIKNNVERWISQMRLDTDESVESMVARFMPEDGPVNVDLEGRLIARINPRLQRRHDKPGFRLLATIVETLEGPYFVKLTGPKKTVAHWKESYDAFLRTARGEE